MIRKSIKDSVDWIASCVICIALFVGSTSANKEGYYGKYLGPLSQLHHGVSGEVFAVDARTLHIRNFNYDGEGPAAYFYAGSSKAPGAGGFRVRDERGTTNVLPRYRNKHITIALPDGQTLQNIRWFSVWCDEFSVNFGDVKIPKNLDFPKPQKINGLSGVHGVSSEPIVIVDAQTLLIPSFSYDGEAPDAKFWVGRGFKPSPQGIRIPDENGKELPLRRYDRKTIVLTLPGDLTIFDIGHFGVWCEAFTVDFGHVQIPRGLNVPPSLKMLGVSPQSKLNCEVLWDDFAFEVRWAVAGDSIVLQLVARLENNEYMSFGLSGDKTRSRMVNGDVVVAWVDKESLKGYAQDYYLDAKSQCSGGRGSCPDDNIVAGTDSVRLLNAALVNGYSIVTFQRSLKAQDELDIPVFTNQSQPIIWAIGPLNSRKEVSYHSLANRGDIFIDFGRSPKWNCPTPESVSDQAEPEEPEVDDREYEPPKAPAPAPAPVPDTRSQDIGRRESRPKTQIPTPAPAPKSNAWDIPAIKCYEPEDGVFYAQMGPTGGKHGYSAITGHVGWGISWYINGLLIPEINVVRGRTYTFIVEGGLDPETPARYHPFYITDDPVGGYQYKTPEERANIQIFAGAVQNKRGEVRPTGVGRLCNWTPDPNQPPADEFASFGAYQRTLRLECDPGNPGIIQWTVEKDTPDTVYYQCYTHRYLGWKINVHDHCEGGAASEPVPAIVKAPSDVADSYETDSEGSESINYETRVKPDYEFLKNTFGKNQTVGVNEFVNQDTIIRFRPELVAVEPSPKPDQEITLSKNPFVNHQVIEGIQSRIPQTYLYPVQPQITLLQQQVPNIPIAPLPQLKAPQTNRAPNAPLYRVTEEPSEEENPQVFQNFHIVPVPKPVEGFPNHQIKVEPLQQEVVSIQTMHIPEQNKFDGEFPKTHQILRAQAEEKLKKHNQKLSHHAKLTNRLPGPPNRLRKPQPPHALTLQQRPFPPGAFRPPSFPPKIQKRPGLQKIPHHPPIKHPQHHHHHHGPEDSNRQELQQHKLQHLKRPPVQEPRPSDLLGASTSLKNLPFAHNTGFDPNSVQVEGGFKPILNTGIAPKSNVNVIDRADTDVKDDADGNAGTVDLTEDKDSGEVRKTEDGLSADKEMDLFKDLKPQTFEPMFIPSFPDDSFKKHKKKPILPLKHRNDQFQYYNPQKAGHVYVKMRPTANLVPRPLYPDSVVPPFRIPSKGRIPQFRNTDSEEEEELDVQVNNDTLIREDRAENIMEVMEMSENRSNKTADEDEVAMADERKDYYLPPRFLSYDGKVVKADLAPVLPESSPPAADLSKLPQFVPFRGAIPPLTQTVNAKSLPQLRTSKLARHDILPPSGSKPEDSFSKDSLNSQGTESQGRQRRSPDHIPGHVGHDHDHDHDHHDHHDHHHHNGSAASDSNLLLVTLLSFTFFFLQTNISL